MTLRWGQPEGVRSSFAAAGPRTNTHGEQGENAKGSQVRRRVCWSSVPSDRQAGLVRAGMGGRRLWRFHDGMMRREEGGEGGGEGVVVATRETVKIRWTDGMPAQARPFRRHRRCRRGWSYMRPRDVEGDGEGGPRAGWVRRRRQRDSAAGRPGRKGGGDAGAGVYFVGALRPGPGGWAGMRGRNRRGCRPAGTIEPDGGDEGRDQAGRAPGSRASIRITDPGHSGVSIRR